LALAVDVPLEPAALLVVGLHEEREAFPVGEAIPKATDHRLLDSVSL
jgi:hypothetical protein